MDNIEDPTIEEISSMETAVERAKTPKAIADTEMFNLIEACDRVTSHYNKPLNIKFMPPMQIVDGCSANMLDADSNNVLASVRMRFRNKLLVDTNTGNLNIEISLSDITFNNSHITIATTPQNN